MRHDRATLTALSHMQYDLFCTRNRAARGFLSLALILIAVLYGGGSWWSLLLIAYAAYLTTSTYAASNRTANRIADQLEAEGLPLPASRYQFEQKKMRVFNLANGEELEGLPYGETARLGEDYDAFYARALATADAEEQTELFKACERVLTEQAANVYLMDPPEFVAMQKNVSGYRFYPALYILDLASLYKTA